MPVSLPISSSLPWEQNLWILAKLGPADMAAISISVLATFFNVEPKLINRGEDYYNSKHVEFLEYS